MAKPQSATALFLQKTQKKFRSALFSLKKEKARQKNGQGIWVEKAYHHKAK